MPQLLSISQLQCMCENSWGLMNSTRSPLLRSCRLRPSSCTWSCSTCCRSSCRSVSCTKPILSSFSPFSRNNARPVTWKRRAQKSPSLSSRYSTSKTLKMHNDLWWHAGRTPPRRTDSCEDSVSSAIYKHLAVTRAQRGGSGWAVLGLCDISHNCHCDTADKHTSTKENIFNPSRSECKDKHTPLCTNTHNFKLHPNTLVFYTHRPFFWSYMLPSEPLHSSLCAHT